MNIPTNLFDRKQLSALFLPVNIFHPFWPYVLSQTQTQCQCYRFGVLSCFFFFLSLYPPPIHLEDSCTSNPSGSSMKRWQLLTEGQGLCPERLRVECQLCLQCSHQVYSALLSCFKDYIHSFPLQIKLTDKELLLFLLTWRRKNLLIMRGSLLDGLCPLCSCFPLVLHCLLDFTSFHLGKAEASQKQDRYSNPLQERR